MAQQEPLVGAVLPSAQPPQPSNIPAQHIPTSRSSQQGVPLHLSTTLWPHQKLGVDPPQPVQPASGTATSSGMIEEQATEQGTIAQLSSIVVQQMEIIQRQQELILQMTQQVKGRPVLKQHEHKMGWFIIITV